MCGLFYKWRLFTCSTQVSTLRAFDRIALAMSFMRLFKHTPGIAANCFQNLSICVHLCIAAVPSLLTAKRSKHHMSAVTLTPTPYICRMHLTILNFSIWCFWTSLAPWRRRMPHSHLTVGGTAIPYLPKAPIAVLRQSVDHPAKATKTWHSKPGEEEIGKRTCEPMWP